VGIPMKLKLKKDDLVQVVAGKDKDKQGKIVKVYPETQRVLVEGVNLVKRHVRPNQMNPDGGIMTRPAPISFSNVMIIDPETQKPTRVGKKWVEDSSVKKGGRWIRVAKKSGADLDAAAKRG
jgi:large subunit ribosomal protein L24